MYQLSGIGGLVAFGGAVITKSVTRMRLAIGEGTSASALGNGVGCPSDPVSPPKMLSNVRFSITMTTTRLILPRARMPSGTATAFAPAAPFEPA